MADPMKNNLNVDFVSSFFSFTGIPTIVLSRAIGLETKNPSPEKVTRIGLELHGEPELEQLEAAVRKAREEWDFHNSVQAAKSDHCVAYADPNCPEAVIRQLSNHNERLIEERNVLQKENQRLQSVLDEAHAISRKRRTKLAQIKNLAEGGLCT